MFIIKKEEKKNHVEQVKILLMALINIKVFLWRTTWAGNRFPPLHVLLQAIPPDLWPFIAAV